MDHRNRKMSLKPQCTITHRHSHSHVLCSFRLCAPAGVAHVEHLTALVSKKKWQRLKKKKSDSPVPPLLHAAPQTPPVVPSEVENKASACPSSQPLGVLGWAGQHSSPFWSELVMGNVYQQSSPPITGLRLIVSLHFKRPFWLGVRGEWTLCDTAYLLAAHLHMPAAAAATSYFLYIQKRKKTHPDANSWPYKFLMSRNGTILGWKKPAVVYL